MKIESIYSHRFAEEIVNQTPVLKSMFDEIIQVISEISEEQLLSLQSSNFKAAKSISKAINRLIKSGLVEKNWIKESKIFKGANYQHESAWALDFSKSLEITFNRNIDGEIQETKKRIGVAVEVAFNHGEAAAWNILKPVLAAELNHVEKETDIGEGIGVLIVVSAEMEKLGGFDGAVGNYERYMKHLAVMRNQLSVPMLIISLAAPETFYISRFPKDHPVASLRGRSTGEIVKRI